MSTVIFAFLNQCVESGDRKFYWNCNEGVVTILDDGRSRPLNNNKNNNNFHHKTSQFSRLVSWIQSYGTSAILKTIFSFLCPLIL